MQFKILLCCKLRPSSKLISLLLSRVPINNSNYYCTVDYKANINITKKTNNMSRLFSSITERGSGLESAWLGYFPEQTWLKFGIGSRLLEVLYVKSKKNTSADLSFWGADLF
jgi:hypothetical protein